MHVGRGISNHLTLLQSVTISEAEEKYILLIKIKLIKNIIALKFSIVSITQNIAPE